MKGCVVPFEVTLHISHLLCNYSNDILLNVVNIFHSYLHCRTLVNKLSIFFYFGVYPLATMNDFTGTCDEFIWGIDVVWFTHGLWSQLTLIVFLLSQRQELHKALKLLNPKHYCKILSKFLEGLWKKMSQSQHIWHSLQTAYHLRVTGVLKNGLSIFSKWVK